MCQEVMFRNSVWSRDEDSIALRDLTDVDSPRNRVGNERPYRPLGLVSKFSIDSTDNKVCTDTSSPPLSSPLSFISYHIKAHTRRYGSRSPTSPSQTRQDNTVAQGHDCYVTQQRHKNDTRTGIPLRQPDLNAITGEEGVIWEEPSMSLSRVALYVMTICIAHFGVQAGIGQTLPIMKDIGSRFQISNANYLSSVIAGYEIALGVIALIAGRLGEVLGHKHIFILGLGWSSASAVAVGASYYSARPLIILSRALQGLGAALTLPTGLELLGAMPTTDTRRAKGLQLYAAMSPLGLIGGALGTSLVERFTWWPWTYWAFSITLAVLGIVSCFTIPSTPRPENTPSGAWATTLRLDLPGMITGIMSLGLFGFAWGQAHVVGWQETYPWIILILSVVIGVLFVTIEAFYAPKPLIPYSALSSWVVFCTLVAAGCGWMCFGIWIFYCWQFVEHLRFTSPLWTTAQFAPIAVVGCIAAITTPFIFDRVGPYAVFCTAMAALTIGSSLIPLMDIREGYWNHMFTGTLLIAWGLYTSIPAATWMIWGAVNKRHRHIAAELVGVVMYCSMGIGLAVAGTVERYMTSGRVMGRSRLRDFRAVFWTSVVMAGLGLLLGLALFLSCGRRRALGNP